MTPLASWPREAMAFGAVIAEGQPVRIPEVPGRWRFHHGGHLDDPDFNNVHVELAPE